VLEQLFRTTNVVLVVVGVGEPTGFTIVNEVHLTTLPQLQFVDDDEPDSSFEHDIAITAKEHNNNFFIGLVCFNNH